MPASDVSPEIVIKREPSLLGWTVPWQVLLDGRFVGWIANGASLAFRASPGSHAVVVGPVNRRQGNHSEPFQFDAAAGRRVELVTRATMRQIKVWRSAASAITGTHLAGMVAEIVINREAVSPGSGQPLQVALDGQFVGRVANGGSLAFQASPGSHAVVAGRSVPFRFDAVAGERVELVTRVEMWRVRIWRPEASAPPEVSASLAGTVIEGTRYEVPLGDEACVIDNAKSTAAITRVVRLTREWTRTYTINVERATTRRGSGGLHIGVLDLKAEAERTLSKTYEWIAGKRETFEEEVTLTVAPRTCCKVIFSWKEIRQKGVVQFTGGGSQVRIPYEVVARITFDQQQIDDQA